MTSEQLNLIKKLQDEVLNSLKNEFVAKDEIIDLMGLCLVARENIFLYGPPGTAKSALVNGLAHRIQGRSFDYLLTRFTEPNELFGPFDINKLREGELVTNTEGMLPQADIVFLDELLNANSAILNSLLLALNERIFRRGRETTALPALTFAGASNHLPEDETLQALFDRFLIRVHCGPVPEGELGSVLTKGWVKEQQIETNHSISAEDVRTIQGLIPQVNLAPVQEAYLDIIVKLRSAGLALSDRRAVRLQRIIAASALLCGRSEAKPSDLWVLKHTWDRSEQREVIASIVNTSLAGYEEEITDHPRSRPSHLPDAESLAECLSQISKTLAEEANENEKAVALDQLQALSSRVSWLAPGVARSELEEKIQSLWPDSHA